MALWIGMSLACGCGGASNEGLFGSERSNLESPDARGDALDDLAAGSSVGSGGAATGDLAASRAGTDNAGTEALSDGVELADAAGQAQANAPDSESTASAVAAAEASETPDAGNPPSESEADAGSERAEAPDAGSPAEPEPAEPDVTPAPDVAEPDVAEPSVVEPDVAEPEVVTEPVGQSNCGDGFYSSASGNCYLLMTAGKTPHDAVIDCQSRGGWLATITDEDEQADVAEGLGDFSSDVFIGATDEGSEGNFRWFNGDPWDFEDWNEGQPNNIGGAEHCVILGEDSLWQDVPCVIEEAYLCEKPPAEATACRPGAPFCPGR